MEKALKMGKTSATGSFQLFVGKTLSTVIMAAGTIILGILMLEEEYGLYAIAMIPSTMITLFRDWGIASAMTKYTAQLRTQNKENNIHDVIMAGITFEIATGLILSLLSFILANFMASTIFHRPELTPLISIASLTIFSGSLLMASQSIFIGYERMELNTLTMICQSILKTLAAPLLVYLGYGVLGAVLGNTLSYLAAGTIGIITLYFLLFRKLRKNKTKNPGILPTLKMMLQYGVPLSISTILIGFQIQFYSFMMAFYCAPALIGNYRIATNFSVLITFFTYPISTVLFPAFAKINPKQEHQLLKDIFTSSVKYTILFLIPATMAIMALSKPMIHTIFGQKWSYAPLFLTLYVTTHLLTITGRLSMNRLLTGLGKTKLLMKLSILTLTIGIPLAFLLIPTLGIIGAIIGTILAGIPSMFLGLHWIWKHYQVKADFKSSTKILIASTVATLATYLSLNFINTAHWIELATGATIFLTAYLLTAPVIGAINQTEINNLRTLFSGLGIISKLINIPLTLVEKTIILAASSSTEEK